MHKLVLEEMAAKHLAMLGASVLLLVHECHGQSSSNAVAGKRWSLVVFFKEPSYKQRVS